MRAALLTASVVLGVALGGCGAVPPPDDLPDGGAPLTLGTIAADPTGFVPLTDGEQATLVPGAQGGFHVWMKFRSPLRAGDATIIREAHRVSDGALVLHTEGDLTLGDGSGGYWELPTALPMFMCPTPVGISILDTAIDFSITVRGAMGEGSGHVRLVPECPADAIAFCQQICAG